MCQNETCRNPAVILSLVCAERSQCCDCSCLFHNPGGGHQSHTGAVFISVNKTPVRASVEDAEYFVRFIDHLIEEISPGGEWSQYFPRDRDAVLGRYRQAKAIYQKIATEAKAAKDHPLVARETGKK